MPKILIIGVNGVGKSHFAHRLSQLRPDLPALSIDALKLTTHWQQRPRAEVEASLKTALMQPGWIVEGGPSFAKIAIPHADTLIWLDPSFGVQLRRLALRPWRNFGITRAGLPQGNVDWPLQQYRFAWRSLARRRALRGQISAMFHSAENLKRWHLRNADEVAMCLASLHAPTPPTPSL